MVLVIQPQSGAVQMDSVYHVTGSVMESRTALLLELIQYQQMRRTVTVCDAMMCVYVWIVCIDTVSDSCSIGSFNCSSDQCIDGNHMCDGFNDCANKADEDESICCKIYSLHALYYCYYRYS